MPVVHDLVDRRPQRRREATRAIRRPDACGRTAPLTGGRCCSISTKAPPTCSPNAATSRPRGQLSVAEIIARHQEQQRAQDALVRNYSPTRGWSSTSGRRSPIPGYDVVTENRYFVAGDGRRVGRAVVFGQRLEVGSRPAAVSAAAAGEGAVAAAPAAVRRGLPLSARRHRERRRVRLLRRAIRAGPRATRRSIAAPSGSIARPSRACACRRCRAGCRRRSCRTRRPSTTRRSPTSATGRCSCSAA